MLNWDSCFMSNQLNWILLWTTTISARVFLHAKMVIFGVIISLYPNGHLVTSMSTWNGPKKWKTTGIVEDMTQMDSNYISRVNGLSSVYLYIWSRFRAIHGNPLDSIMLSIFHKIFYSSQSSLKAFHKQNFNRRTCSIDFTHTKRIEWIIFFRCLSTELLKLIFVQKLTPSIEK